MGSYDGCVSGGLGIRWGRTHLDHGLIKRAPAQKGFCRRAANE
jgi:hypothetical protein